MKNVAIISCSVSSLSGDGVTLRSGGIRIVRALKGGEVEEYGVG